MGALNLDLGKFGGIKTSTMLCHASAFEEVSENRKPEEEHPTIGRQSGRIKSFSVGGLRHFLSVDCGIADTHTKLKGGLAAMNADALTVGLGACVCSPSTC